MRDEVLAPTTLMTQASYVHAVRPALPASAFAPATSRLALIPLYLAVVGVASVAIVRGWLPWLAAPALSLAIGASFACLTFLAHEALHGGVGRDRRLRYAVGWIGFLPFAVAPRLWVAWHDRVHHANANVPGDPDMYPTLETYQASRRVRFFINAFSLGCRRWRGGLSLILGFTVQAAHQLIVATDRGFLSARERRWAIAETAIAAALWVTVAVLVGGVAFVFVYVLPLLIANTIVMAFILTNHSLSPRVAINDPLVSGLSVTAPPWIEWLTLRFGFHVEHHLFPAMSSRHAHLVRAELTARWPGRYQAMPLGRALAALHRTARVYKDARTLIDPRTGREFPTLLPAT
jgi:fatty acid desaturase